MAKIPSVDVVSWVLFRLVLFRLLLLLCSIPCHSALIKNPAFQEEDIRCLNETKAELIDPNQSLFTWRFGNSSMGYICNFVGIQCWHNDDGKVLSTKLPSMELSGHFPSGLKYCGSMTNLDLSGNSLSGSIPKDLCNWLPFLVQIDLSSNQFSGSIPPELANCTYLNVLKLNDNQLSGQIPWELTRLERLNDFNFANNLLTGPIPAKWASNSTDLFVGNSGLCSKPLNRACTGSSTTSMGVVIGGAAAGVLVVCLLGFAFWWYFIRLTPEKLAALKDENKWAKRIKGPKSIQLHMFEKPIVKIRLADLMTATNDFSPENIIGTGRTGTVYKASLADGSVLAIKRLKPSAQTEKQFKSEMNTLAHLRHRNLVPLLGYCVAGQEKLLVYKHMVKGNLWECLHNEHSLDWTSRLKIGIGAARGLAWLHHSCNPRVIHRNISSSSILLDEDYEPRITDFGLARLMNPVDTHLSTFINGDFGDLGYVAPEYMRTLVATLKGDVFSFGVVLLELVTGQKPIDVVTGDESFKGNLVDWITQLSNNGHVKEAIEKSLVGDGHDDELLQFLRVACACVLSGPKERPSMYEVYQLLRAIGEKYNFSDQNDEIPLATGTTDADYSDELIVARDTV